MNNKIIKNWNSLSEQNKNMVVKSFRNNKLSGIPKMDQYLTKFNSNDILDIITSQSGGNMPAPLLDQSKKIPLIHATTITTSRPEITNYNEENIKIINTLKEKLVTLKYQNDKLRELQTQLDNEREICQIKINKLIEELPKPIFETSLSDDDQSKIINNELKKLLHSF